MKKDASSFRGVRCEGRRAQKSPETGNTKKHFEQKITARRSRNHKGRGVGEPEDWSGVLARSAKSMGSKRPALPLENRRPTVPSGGRADAQKAAKGTKTDQELGSCHDLALPKLRNGEPAKHAKRRERG